MAKAISSSKAYSRKQTITQAAASDADMERMVPEGIRKPCLEKCQSHEAAIRSHEEELKALAKAKTVIFETTYGADSIAMDLAKLPAT